MKNFLILILFVGLIGHYGACFSRNITLYSGLSQTGDIVCGIDLAHLENEFINFDTDGIRNCNPNEASSMTICDVSSSSQFGIYSSSTGSTLDGNSYMLISITKRIKSCYTGIVNFELGYSDDYVTANYYNNNDKNGLNGDVSGVNISLNNITPFPTYYPTAYPTPSPTPPTHAPTKSPTGDKYDILFYNTEQYNPVLDSNGNIANYLSRLLSLRVWYYQGRDINGNKYWSWNQISSESSMNLYYDIDSSKLTCGFMNGTISVHLQCVCSINNNKDPIKCDNQWFVRNNTISWIQLTSMKVYYYQSIKNCQESQYINYTIPDSICVQNQSDIYGTELDGMYRLNGCYDGFPQYIMNVSSTKTQTIKYTYGSTDINGVWENWAIIGYCYATDFLSCDENLRIVKNGSPYLDTQIRITDCSDA